MQRNRENEKLGKMRIKTIFRILSSLVMAIIFESSAVAQVDRLIHSGDSLHMAYDFSAALDNYVRAYQEQALITTSSDTVKLEYIRRRIMLSENGRNMSRLVQKRKVLHRQKFSIEDFFLYYPLMNQGWRPLPNQLDKDSTDFYVRAMYAPDWNYIHYFSAMDRNGYRSLYVTELENDVWTYPKRIDMLSSPDADEIFPMLSPDGKTIYFASRGFNGVGGYDLYQATWNESEQKWSLPRNMGFPYSSPADDFLYIDSEDGEYSLFASNRECSRDSVWVYVLHQEKYPSYVQSVNKDVLLSLSYMNPISGSSLKVSEREALENQLTKAYIEKMAEVRRLRDSISVVSGSLEKMRMQVVGGDVSNTLLSGKISELESTVSRLNSALSKANGELMSIDQEFLREGVFSSSEADGQDDMDEDEIYSEYRFMKMDMGEPLKLNIDHPDVAFDYAFKISDYAQYAENQSLPMGLIYQIHLFNSQSKAYLSDLKGLSPVYEQITDFGLYVYSVGCFTDYEDALNSLNIVRSMGFSDARIVAYDNQVVIPLPVLEIADIVEDVKEIVEIEEIAVEELIVEVE